MHLVRYEQSGELYGGGEAVDLDQTPADIVILTAADTEISLIAAAVRQSKRQNSHVRLANILTLNHPYSVDIYCEKTLKGAKIIAVRLLGGVSYWPYGVEQIAELARRENIHLALLSGDGGNDPELDRYSTLPAEELRRLNGYFSKGGIDNAIRFLDALDDIIHGTKTAKPAADFLNAGIYWPKKANAAPQNNFENNLENKPVIACVFYRAMMQSGDTKAIDATIEALENAGLAPLPIYVASLKDETSAKIIRDIFKQYPPQVILNMTSFAVSKTAEVTEGGKSPGPFGAVDAPVIQVILASDTEKNWQDGTAGLTPRDLAMNVVLPELDGRIIGRAIAFKTPPKKDPITEAMITAYEPNLERVDWTARLAAAYQQLGEVPAPEKRIAIIMANYPNKDGRIANGVGLDTPQSGFVILKALQKAGYNIENMPKNGQALIENMLTAPTNASIINRTIEATLNIADYNRYFTALPPSVQKTISDQWGAVQSDPMFMAAQQSFAISVRHHGGAVIAVQPARGYNIDPKQTYHDPELPPPHNYLAFYFWLRHAWGAHAVIHLGKHGNLEWLPGKALALDNTCLPDAILGAVPNFYPFIVNDPGEGAQAKRRIAATIIDHLTPAMTSADSHGNMAEIEMLMDEYYEAAGLDQRRCNAIMDTIINTANRNNIDKDCGIDPQDSDQEKLLKLDNFLCDIKEMQIRDGLHIFGESPQGNLNRDLIAAILRIPRGEGEGGGGITRALAHDLKLEDFDPLNAAYNEPWTGLRPKILKDIDKTPWRHQGDTVERLRNLALILIDDPKQCPDEWTRTKPILETALPIISEAIAQSGRDEIGNLIKGLGGGYVPTAPAGAPTRGRPEVLPTGRNFFSIDSRAVPTETAWHIGWASAMEVIEKYLQDNGNYPQSIIMSAWGTANMRTGGDDIAQALAFMGVQPKWEGVSRRVTGFDIMPQALLGRPRVDVTMRCSGFFRDAFPSQITLIDKAARAVGALDEPPEQNPIAAKMKQEKAELITQGHSETEAELKAGFRVFSTKPGAYGAGLQALIDEGIWSKRDDFADSFTAWSHYAYGEDNFGTKEKKTFQNRLAQTEAIIHNQDNREHDILDSDDYYQFIGGLAASVAQAKGQDVPIYMNDHSVADRPVTRRLDEEITRVVRGRACNPKWIAGVMRHGYKGAFEIAATLDYLFAFAATTKSVPNHLFDAVYEAWIDNKEVADFIKDNNPNAFDDMIARFLEAIEREMWNPRRNSTLDELKKLKRNGEKNE